jgi:hypothetical protein
MRLLNSSTGISMFPSGNNTPGYEFKPSHARSDLFQQVFSATNLMGLFLYIFKASNLWRTAIQ